MTQPDDDGQLRFETFATIDELFAPDQNLVSFSTLSEKKILSLSPRIAKSSSMEGLDSIFQAGTHGAIVHGPSKTSGRAVYYSQNVDQDFYEFIRKNKYYLASVYAAAAPTTNFPIGAMEFKYSWRIVEPGDDTSGFFVAPAQITLLKEDTKPDGSKTVVTDPGNVANVQVALVGVHVVGVVKDHPEFIWATFEHVDNAPDLPVGMSQSSDQPVSAKDWTFYHANTAAKDSNLPNANSLVLVDAVNQLLSPAVDVFRAFPWGGGSPANVANIQSLNTSIRQRVLGSNSVWSNYQLIGGVWSTPNNLKPGGTVRPQIGSTSLANTTMETFDQQFAGVNCFGCHTTSGGKEKGVTLPPMNMNISHIMTNAFFRQQTAANTEKQAQLAQSRQDK